MKFLENGSRPQPPTSPHPVQLIPVDMENVCLCGYVELVGSCVRARVCVRVGVCVYVIVTLNSQWVLVQSEMICEGQKVRDRKSVRVCVKEKRQKTESY